MLQFDSFHGSRQSFLDGFFRATDHVTLTSQVAVVFGYGDIGRGCAIGLKEIGARVFVVEIDPVRAFEALVEGFPVRTVEDVVSEADIFVTATMNRDVVTIQHMTQMKNNAIVLNMGQFDNEIDFQGLKAYRGIKRVTIKPFIADRFTFSESDKSIIVLGEGRKLNFVSASGQPSFLRSFSFTNHVMALLQLWNKRKSCNFERQVYVLPKHLQEKNARIHISYRGARLTTLTSEQASYLNVPIEGPFEFGTRILL